MRGNSPEALWQFNCAYVPGHASGSSSPARLALHRNSEDLDVIRKPFSTQTKRYRRRDLRLGLSPISIPSRATPASPRVPSPSSGHCPNPWSCRASWLYISCFWNCFYAHWFRTKTWFFIYASIPMKSKKSVKSWNRIRKYAKNAQYLGWNAKMTTIKIMMAKITQLTR